MAAREEAIEATPEDDTNEDLVVAVAEEFELNESLAKRIVEFVENYGVDQEA